MNETIIPFVNPSSIIYPTGLYKNEFYLTNNQLSNINTIDSIFFETIQDGDPYTASLNSLVINEGHTVSVSNRCKGLYLNVKNLIVNGTLSMTARGCISEGCYVGIDYKKKAVYYSDENIYPEDLTIIGPVGGLGIQGVKCSNGVNNACGSGGGTTISVNGYTSTQRGGNGTCFSGGSGAGGCGTRNPGSGGRPNSGYVGSDIGGAGGNGWYNNGYEYTSKERGEGGGGGAGNPGGTSHDGIRNGENGTGGLLIIFADKITIGENGSIQSNGCSGGNGYSASGKWSGGAGGSSGGGAIHIFFKELIGNVNNIIANGGTVTATVKAETASKGGNGTINLVNVGLV